MIKKIAKYATNILGAISMLLVGINQIEGIDIPYAMQIIEVIAVVQGVIGTYLLGGKAIQTYDTDEELEDVEEVGE